MRAISVRQPWAWAILQLGKRVENRTWKPPAKLIGRRILLHALKASAPAEELLALQWMAARGLFSPGTMNLDWPGLANLERGGIVGRVRLVGCVSYSSDPWFMGPIGWLLDEATSIPFVACRGALGCWKAPQDVEAQLGGICDDG